MKLADYLAASRLTQSQFAITVGCTQGRISQLLAGKLPSFELARAISKATAGSVGLDDWTEADIKVA